jgi:hypothetical protein
MESLFQLNTTDQVLDRLEKLQADTQPLWGKMNVSQMIAHCKAPLEVALGKKKMKQTFLGVLFGKIAKKQMLKPVPMKKNLPTVPDFIVRYAPDFFTEKQQLASLIKQFSLADRMQIVEKPHPFFGKMTAEEWGWLQYKHLDHHLRQFGV